MDAHNTLPAALQRAVERVLAALFRLLLRHGMSFTAFENTAKRVYVDVALSEFTIPGKKPSISRASILSGLTRKEVQRLLAERGAARSADGNEHENRALRVLGAWTRDADFLDAAGQPRVLELQAGAISFAALVRRHSGDMPVRAVLDELLRVGAVARLDDGRLQLVQRAFLPRGAADKLEHLGSDVADLIDTIDHNVERGDADPRFQRRVIYHDVPAAVAAEFRALSGKQAMALLVKLDRWLAAKEAENATTPLTTPPRLRLGMGIYYFEQGQAPSSTPKD
jgi:predicted HTH domain antitoxin